MSTAVDTRTPLRAMEDAFLRRIQAKKDDAGTASVLEELFEEVRISSDKGRVGEATYATVAVGLVAMRLWPQIPPAEKFPETRDRVWCAIIDGWVADRIGLTLVQEAVFARFIAKTNTLFPNEDSGTKMATRIQQRLGELRKDVALGKIVRFTKTVDAREDNMTLVRAVTRSLGHCADLPQLILAASVIDALPERTVSPEMGLVMPAIAKFTGDMLRLAEVAFHFFRFIRENVRNLSPELSLEHPGLIQVAFYALDPTGVPPDESVVSLTLSSLRERVLKWRPGNRSEPFAVKLAYRVRTAPDTNCYYSREIQIEENE